MKKILVLVFLAIGCSTSSDQTLAKLDKLDQTMALKNLSAADQQSVAAVVDQLDIKTLALDFCQAAPAGLVVLKKIDEATCTTWRNSCAGLGANFNWTAVSQAFKDTLAYCEMTVKNLKECLAAQEQANQMLATVKCDATADQISSLSSNSSDLFNKFEHCEPLFTSCVLMTGLRTVSQK